MQAASVSTVDSRPMTLPESLLDERIDDLSVFGEPEIDHLRCNQASYALCYEPSPLLILICAGVETVGCHVLWI